MIEDEGKMFMVTPKLEDYSGSLMWYAALTFLKMD